jgi:Peptidase family S41
MLSRAAVTAISFLLVTTLSGQGPTASSPKSASPAPAPSATPTTQQIIDSLNQSDLQAALTALKSTFTNPDALTETELNRATLTGLLVRMPGGLLLMPGKENGATEPPLPFYSEIFENHIGYLRLGALDGTNLKELDKKLQEFGQKKVDALIIDLRASSAGDFPSAAEFAKHFCAKGKALFSIHKPGVRQDRQFTSDRDPSFQGLMVLLVDNDTASGAEAFAAAVRLYNKALVIGQASAGRAVEYSDFPLPSGKTLRVASAEAVLPDSQSLFPGGVKPDLPVEMSIAEKRQIFRQSGEKGMAQFVYETERPHLNEAALIAGTNPELEIPDAQRRTRARSAQAPRDSVVQRALDVVTSLEVYQKH